MNGIPVPNGHHGRFQINTNTGISVGIVILGFVGFFTIMNVLSALKAEIVLGRTETASLKMELNGKIDKNEARIVSLETNKSGVTTTDFFRWAVHLQQANPQMKVPEPEVNK